MGWKFYIHTQNTNIAYGVQIKAPNSSLRSYFSYTSETNCTVYPYLACTNSRYFDYDIDGQNPMGRRIDRGTYTRYENIDFYNANESYGTNSAYGGTSSGDFDESVAAFVVDKTTGKVYAVFWNQNSFSGYWVTSSYAGPGYSLTSLPNQSWVDALNAAGVPGNKMTAAAAAATAAAWSSLQSLSVPTTTTLSSANSTKSSAQGYWNTISQAGSGWTNYTAAQSKYNEIVTAVSNIKARDNAYISLTGLTTPTNTTVQATAKTAKDNADTYWSTIQSKTNSGWSNWSAAETKHTEVVEGYNNTVTRDTRLLDHADKSELNASNTKVRVDYTTPHTKGTADYTSIKSTLTALSKKLNS